MQLLMMDLKTQIKYFSHLKKVFNEAGYVAKGNNNPVRLLLDDVVGEAKE